MNNKNAFLWLCIVCLLCGCASRPESQEDTSSTQRTQDTLAVTATTALLSSSSIPAPVDTGQSTTSIKISTTTSTTKTPGTLAMNLPINRTCTQDAQCTSGCCYLSGERKKCSDAQMCRIRDLGEQECYSNGMYWCINTCQKVSCESCAKRVRCVSSATENGTGEVRVETAQEVSGHIGSCKYTGSFEIADGTDGYCDRHEGNLMQARCGAVPAADDCLRLYNANVLYMIGKVRSFHSPEGAEYDLWCFRCDAAG